MQEHFQEQMLPSIFTIPNDIVFIIEVIKAYFTFFMYIETFVINLIS